MNGANPKETAFGSKNQEFQKIEIQGKRLLVRKIRNFKKSSLEKFRIPWYDKILNSDVTNPFLDFLLNMLISLIKTCAYADGYIALLSVRLILFL